jgi:hypothetical protein
MSDKAAEVAGNGAIPVVQPDGKVGYLPAALANDPAATEGLTRATDTQIRGAQVAANKAATKAELDAQFSGSLASELEGAVAPVLTGAARGLTLGGSDEFIGSVGGEGARRRLLDYQTYAPVGSFAGEIGAIAGAALLGDEAGLGAIPNAVGRLGAGAGTAVAEGLGGGLLARGAGLAVRGGIEGGIYGAGGVVTESALHNAPITGEAMVAGVAHGAAGGIIATGLLHGAGVGLGKVRGAFRPSAEAFDAIAAREFGEAAPGIGKAMAADAEKVAAHPSDVKFGAAGEAGPYRTPGDAVGETYIKARGGDKQHELGEIWKHREVTLRDGAERIDTHSRDLQKAITEQQTAAKVTDMATFGDAKVNHMDKLVDRARFTEQADVVLKWMSGAREAIDLAASDTAVSKLGPAARKEFDGQMARLGKALEAGDSLALFKAADDAKRFVGRQAQFGRRATGLPEAAKAFDALYQGEGGLMQALEHQSWGKAGEAQKAVNAATAQSIGLGQKFSSSFVEEYGSSLGRPDYRANSNKVSTFLGGLTKAANDGDAQAVRDMITTRRAFLDATGSNYDHGPAAVKAMAAERSALDRMESTFDKATKETSLINQAKRLQAEEQAQKIGGLIGLATDTLSKPVTTLQRLAQLEQHTKSVLDKFGGGTKKLVAGTGAETAGIPGELAAPKGAGKGFFSLLLERGGTAAERAAIVGAGRASFDRKAEAMASLQSNPAALTARVGAALGPFATDAPKSTQQATATAMAGLQFLASKMPPNRRDAFTLQPQLQPPTRASDTEIAQHMRYQEALDNPSILLEQAHKGSLTPDHVEAVKAVYPKLYDHMRNQIMQELVTSKSELPYGRRIQLGILLDLPTDQTLAPDFVSAIQATYTASEKAGVEPPPPQLSQLDVAGSLQTGTQSAAGGLDR